MDRYSRAVYPMHGCEVCIRFVNRALYMYGTYQGCAGQIYGNIINELDCHPESASWDAADVRKLCDIWKRWPGNVMRGGTPRQERAVKEFLMSHSNVYNHEAIVAYLKIIGLYEDEGYQYGSSWAFEEVPEDVLEWLFSLPGKGDTYEDMRPREICDADYVSVLNIGGDV